MYKFLSIKVAIASPAWLGNLPFRFAAFDPHGLKTLLYFLNLGISSFKLVQEHLVKAFTVTLWLEFV